MATERGTRRSQNQELLAKVTFLPSKCWYFEGAKDKGGFGLMRWKGKVQLAHRVFWESMCAPLDEGCRLVHHLPKGKCIGAACCNPVHMKIREADAPRLGTRLCRNGHVIDGNNMVTENRIGGIVVRCRICRQEAWRTQKRQARAKLDSHM